MIDTTKRVELDVKQMGQRTTSLRDLKARAAADLYRLQLTKDKVLDQISDINNNNNNDKLNTQKKKTAGGHH